MPRQDNGSLDRLDQAVDLDRYPLHEPNSATFKQLIAYCREELSDDGCCIIRDFLRPQSVERMIAEAEALSPQAIRSEKHHNPYFTEDDPDLPPGHPRRMFQKRTNGFVCYDLIDAASDLRAIFDFDGMTGFVSRAFAKPKLYRYADPLAAMPINTMAPGDTFPWHFDTNEFTVTVVIRTAEKGGVFEYAPDLRSAGDERYDDVAAVLAGDDSRVRRLTLRPGDIQLFEGRYTLHRVTRVDGGRQRHVAIPSWTLRPGMVGNPHRTKNIYGRLTEAHSSQGYERVDALLD